MVFKENIAKINNKNPPYGFLKCIAQYILDNEYRIAYTRSHTCTNEVIYVYWHRLQRLTLWEHIGFYHL